MKPEIKIPKTDIYATPTLIKTISKLLLRNDCHIISESIKNPSKNMKAYIDRQVFFEVKNDLKQNRGCIIVGNNVVYAGSNLEGTELAKFNDACISKYTATHSVADFRKFKNNILLTAMASKITLSK